jgi:hypothetical protein
MNMKKALIVPAVLLLLTTAFAENRLFVSLATGFMRPTDPDFRQIYGNLALLPEVSTTVRVFKGLCLTAGAGKVSEEGRTPELDLEAKASQGYYSGGLGYLFRISEGLSADVNVGIAAVTCREEAMDVVIKGKSLGYRAEAGIYLMEEDGRAFIGLRLGYMSARVSDLNPPVADVPPIKLGGPKIALCFGLQLFGGN